MIITEEDQVVLKLEEEVAQEKKIYIPEETEDIGSGGSKQFSIKRQFK